MAERIAAYGDDDEEWEDRRGDVSGPTAEKGVKRADHRDYPGRHREEMVNAGAQFVSPEEYARDHRAVLGAPASRAVPPMSQARAQAQPRAPSPDRIDAATPVDCDEGRPPRSRGRRGGARHPRPGTEDAAAAADGTEAASKQAMFASFDRVQKEQKMRIAALLAPRTTVERKYADLSQADEQHVRHVVIDFAGSARDMAQPAAQWCLAKERVEQTFNPYGSMHLKTGEYGRKEYTGYSPEKAMILKVEMIAGHNTWGHPVGIATGLVPHPQVYGRAATPFACVLNPGCNFTGTETVLYDAQAAVKNEYVAQYGHHTPESIMKPCVPVGNDWFVPVDSVLLDILRQNPGAHCGYQLTPESFDQKAKNIILPSEVMISAVSALTRDVLGNCPLIDLYRSSTASVHRADGGKWTDLASLPIGADAMSRDRHLGEIHQAGVVLRVTFGYPRDMTVKADEPPADAAHMELLKRIRNAGSSASH